jgi:hypothetical protein
VETSTPARLGRPPWPIHASRTTAVVAAWARPCGQTGLGHEDDLGGGGINSGRFRSSSRMRTMVGGGMGNNLSSSIILEKREEFVGSP